MPIFKSYLLSEGYKGFVQGLLLGIVIVLVVLFYYVLYYQIPLKNFKQALVVYPQIINTCAAYCILVNTILLTYTNYQSAYPKARGIFIATCILALSIFAYKLSVFSIY